MRRAIRFLGTVSLQRAKPPRVRATVAFSTQHPTVAGRAPDGANPAVTITETAGHDAETTNYDQPKCAVTLDRNGRSRYRNGRSRWPEIPNKAFSRLFKYISGNNKSRQKIEMAAPVAQGAGSEKIDMTSPVGQQEADGRWAVSFMMPASYSLETLPEPQDPKVVLRQVPARHIAAVRYSGFWSEEGYMLNRDKLEAWIKKNRFSVVGGPIWARYDPPFMPWFLRRNEILVPIAKPSDNQ